MVWMCNISDGLGRTLLWLATACLLFSGCKTNSNEDVRSDSGQNSQELIVQKDDTPSESDQDSTSRPSDASSYDTTSIDTIVDVAEPCVPSDNGTLAFESDPINFSTQLIGKEHLLTAVLTNSRTDTITVTGMSLHSTTSFRIINPPSVPFALDACESKAITFEMFNEDIFGRSTTHVDISYLDDEGSANSISTTVRGFMAAPEQITCKLVIVSVPDPYHTSGEEKKNIMKIANSGTGNCVIDKIEDIGIADCEVDDNGTVKCPSPVEATKSPVFTRTTTYDGIASERILVGPGSTFISSIHLTGGTNLPEKIPHYGMYFVKAHEYLTGRVSNFPSDEETGTYPWHVCVVD